VALAEQYGTPLYVFDERTLRDRCHQSFAEFRSRYPATDVIYACKAFSNRALLRLLREEGLGCDVVSAGEMHVALAAGVAPKDIYLHGNNKQREELELALMWRIGLVVVDNFDELALLEETTADLGLEQAIMLRLSPGVDAHTHAHVATGVLDSKFGFPLETGQAAEAARLALASGALKLTGYHFHLGSQITETGPYVQAVKATLDFAGRVRDETGFSPEDLSVGGGFPIQYTEDEPVPPLAAFAESIVAGVREGCASQGLAEPRLIVEPGRSIVGRAGVALYRLGARKTIPGVRSYVSVDGGMADNIRPVIYGSRYQALLANRPLDAATVRVTVAGRYCESGDVLIRDAQLPEPQPGDLLAVPCSGAYCLPLASNYNASLKPAVLLVAEGEARVIRRRETYEDLMRLDG